MSARSAASRRPRWFTGALLIDFGVIEKRGGVPAFFMKNLKAALNAGAEWSACTEAGDKSGGPAVVRCFDEGRGNKKGAFGHNYCEKGL